MPSKATLLRIEPESVEKIEKIQQKNGLPFATVCKSLINEKLNEMFPDIAPSKATDPGTLHEHAGA